MSDDGREFYPWGGWGMQIPSGQPEGQLAECETERKATPQRIAAARQLFPEAQLSDFEAIGHSGRRLRHLASGREFMVAQEQVLMGSATRVDPASSSSSSRATGSGSCGRGAGMVTSRSASRARSSRASFGDRPAAACGWSTCAPALS